MLTLRLPEKKDSGKPKFDREVSIIRLKIVPSMNRIRVIPNDLSFRITRLNTFFLQKNLGMRN